LPLFLLSKNISCHEYLTGFLKSAGSEYQKLIRIWFKNNLLWPIPHSSMGRRDKNHFAIASAAARRAVQSYSNNDLQTEISYALQTSCSEFSIPELVGSHSVKDRGCVLESLDHSVTSGPASDVAQNPSSHAMKPLLRAVRYCPADYSFQVLRCPGETV
jgi:hypothetical protein